MVTQFPYNHAFIQASIWTCKDKKKPKQMSTKISFCTGVTQCNLCIVFASKLYCHLLDWIMQFRRDVSSVVAINVFCPRQNLWIFLQRATVEKHHNQIRQMDLNAFVLFQGHTQLVSGGESGFLVIHMMAEGPGISVMFSFLISCSVIKKGFSVLCLHRNQKKIRGAADAHHLTHLTSPSRAD